VDRATGAEGAAQVTITPGDKPASAKLSGGGTRAMLPACFSREIVQKRMRHIIAVAPPAGLPPYARAYRHQVRFRTTQPDISM
jgi:hypothetical protein